LSVTERIEELRAELKGHAFAETRNLLRAGIPVIDLRSVEEALEFPIVPRTSEVNALLLKY
jgi:hypothetical protein